MIIINNQKINKDRHLNVFWQYDGKPWLENNITKALINAFDSLDNQSKRAFVEEFFGFDLPDNGVSYQIFLQTNPSKGLINSMPAKEVVKSIPESNRLLFAFSPTGEAWGNYGIAEGYYDNNGAYDPEEIKSYIRQSIKKQYPTEDDGRITERVDKEFKETCDNIMMTSLT